MSDSSEPGRVLQDLEALDLDSIRVGDLRNLKNPAIKKALLDALDMHVSRPEHTSHGEHANHYKAAVMLEPITEDPV